MSELIQIGKLVWQNADLTLHSFNFYYRARTEGFLESCRAERSIANKSLPDVSRYQHFLFVFCKLIYPSKT
jgi:hypothetical protein